MGLFALIASICVRPTVLSARKRPYFRNKRPQVDSNAFFFLVCTVKPSPLRQQQSPLQPAFPHMYIYTVVSVHRQVLITWARVPALAPIHKINMAYTLVLP